MEEGTRETMLAEARSVTKRIRDSHTHMSYGRKGQGRHYIILRHKGLTWAQQKVHDEHRLEWIFEQPEAGQEKEPAISEEKISAVLQAAEEVREAQTEFSAEAAAVRKLVGDVEARIEQARRIEVAQPTGKGTVKVRKLGVQHEKFETLLKYVGAGVNVALIGGAGSGKTEALNALSRALRRPGYIQPLGPQTTKSDLLGFRNAAGKYVPSLLREGFENGGIILLDEMDAANPAVLTIINGMLANQRAGFPDGMVERHPDTLFLCAMNTFGRGADMQFVGRAQLDAATLDRWVYLEWNTDWSFAHALAGNDEWTDYVQSLAEAVASFKGAVRVTIGMRAALHGAKLLAAGVDREEVERVCIWAPIKEDDKQKILAALPVHEADVEVTADEVSVDESRCPRHGQARRSRYDRNVAYCPARDPAAKRGFCEWRGRFQSEEA